MVYRQAVRGVLFRIGRGDAETAHELTLRALSLVCKAPPLLAGMRRYFGANEPRSVFGVRFPSVVGLAAGMDKNGIALLAWPALGFGHVEVGTVTWHPQPGNPRPRLYRLPESQALINRMGFNNDGAQALAARLRALGQLPVPLGISIGKSKITPVADAVEDYLKSLRELYRYGDYFAVNVSSPNTPGLRSLQDRAALAELVGALTEQARALAGERATPKPLLVKIAPDLTEHAISELLAVCIEHGVSGIIAGNTTVERDGIAATESATGTETGGLSGAPLAHRARKLVRFVHSETSGELPIIGVGGVTTTADATAMLDAGASLLQLYTGFIYQGPGLVRQIGRTL